MAEPAWCPWSMRPAENEKKKKKKEVRHVRTREIGESRTFLQRQGS